jgi:putative inorganic carbon (HCO3(-)) transporter
MLRTIAFVVAMLVGFGAGLFSRYAALLFYLWFAIFRPQEWVWIDIEQFRFSLLVGLLLVVPAILTGVIPNVAHPLTLGMIAFLVTAFIGSMNAVDPPIAWFNLELLARIVVVSLFLVTLVNTRERFVQTMAVIAGSLGAHASKFGVSFIMWGGVRFDSGIGGAFGDNNNFALAIARILFLLLATSQNIRNRWVKLGFLAAVPLSFLGLMSTYSRGGFLAAAAGGVVYLLLQRRRVLSVTFITAAAVLVLVFVPIPSAYLGRLATIQSYEEVGDRSAKGRIHYWTVALAMARENPSGLGLRNYERAYDRYDFSGGEYGTQRSVHNSHLQALVETGYAGLLVWAGLLLYSVWTCFRVRRLAKHPALDADTQRFFFTTSNALLASLAAFLVGGTFLAEVLSDLNWFIFGLIAALHLIGKRSVNRAQQPVLANAASLSAAPTPSSGDVATVFRSPRPAQTSRPARSVPHR